MATIRDIEIGNSYRGDPILGGKYSQGVTIDSTPLQKLATFAYYRDRDFWMKKVAEDKAAAKEIADLTAYDISSPMKEYTDYLIAKKNEAKDYLEKHPNALYFDRDRKGYQEFHEIVSEFDRARKAANTSGVIYSANQALIDRLPEGAAKEAEKLGLDYRVKKLFENGIDYALNNPLASAQELNPDTYKIPDLAITKRTFVVNDKNGTQISEVEFGDLDNLYAQAAGAWFGLKEPLDVTTEKFKSLPKDKQELLIAQDKVIREKRLGIESTTNLFNGMLGAIKKANHDLKIENISTDNLPETIRENIISATEFNRQVADLNSLAKQKYKRINLDDGLSGEEVIALQWFQKNGKTLYSEGPKKIQESEQHRMEIARGNLKARLAEVGISQQRLDKENQADLLDADAVLQTVSSIIKKGEAAIAGALPDINIPAVNYFKKGVNKDIFVISEPSLLKEFGRIDKDGNQYDVPNIVEYNKKTGQLNLKYYTPDSDEKKTTIDESRTHSLDERDWLGLKVKQMFPTKEIGNVNALINQALKSNHNSLYELANNYDKPKTKTYTYNGKEVTEQQINDAAALWNLTPEEYIKKFNIK